MASLSLSQFGLCDLLDPYPVGVNRSPVEKPSQVSSDSTLGVFLILGEERASRIYFYVDLVAFQERVTSEPE